MVGSQILPFVIHFRIEILAAHGQASVAAVRHGNGIVKQEPTVIYYLLEISISRRFLDGVAPFIIEVKNALDHFENIIKLNVMKGKIIVS